MRPTPRPKARGLDTVFALAVVLAVAASLAPPCARAAEGDPEDDFDRRVSESIDRGVTFLHRALEEGIPNARVSDAYPMGIRALPVYALLEAGVSPRAEIIDTLFSQLESLPVAKVYSVAIHVMALDALDRNYEPPPGNEARRERAVAAHRQSVRARMRKLLAWLIGARSIPRGVWGYGVIGRGDPEAWVDFSNTQFAVLALQVGLLHDIDVDRKLFEEIRRAIIQSAIPRRGGDGEVRCQGRGWWHDSKVLPGPPPGDRRTRVAGRDDAVELESEGFTLRGTPLDWPYKPPWIARAGSGTFTRYGMLAAATSSLMVVREALASKRLDDDEREEIDRTVAGGVIALRKSFHTLTPALGGSLFRNYYYDLYSFEKAMDLGGIALLDGIDWYREQARVLMNAQRGDGGWGSATGRDREYDIVSTSFALLFLCRATQNLRVSPVEPIVTLAGADAADPRGVRSGRVFLASQNGMVELEQLFTDLAERRNREYLDLAREVVASVPPAEVPELLPYLARLRSPSDDAVDRFARAQLALIAGLGGAVGDDEVAAWVARWRRIRAWGKEADEGALPELLAVIDDVDATGALRAAAIDATIRIGSLDAVPRLLAALEARSVVVRERAGRALELLTSHRVPFDALADEEDRAAEALPWRRYWRDNEADLRFRSAWERLRRELEEARTREARAAVRARVAALGERALPAIDAIIAEDRFLFDWILIRAAITGEGRGL